MLNRLGRLVHRADYMAVLLDEAQRLGVEIRVGCKVVAVDFDPPAVSLPDGQQLRADVVVGCDGRSPRAVVCHARI